MSHHLTSRHPAYNQSMAEYYRQICDLTLKYRDSKEVVIRKAVITLIPSMATYDTDEFQVTYLHRCMAYLLQALQKPTDRDIGQSAAEKRYFKLTTSLCRTRAYGRAVGLEDEALHRRYHQDHQGALEDERASPHIILSTHRLMEQEEERAIRSAHLPVPGYAYDFRRPDVIQTNARSPGSHVPLGIE